MIAMPIQPTRAYRQPCEKPEHGFAQRIRLGYPPADLIIGLLITIAIFGIVIQSEKSIFARMLDGRARA